MNISRYMRALSLLLSALLLQGCVVAAVPLITAASMAASGFLVYKSVQTTTGGLVRISFQEDEISNEAKMALSQIRRPSIWPDSEAEVYMAQVMESSEAFDEVVTPAMVTREFDKRDIRPDIRLMTQSERITLFREICDELGADAIIAFRDLGAESKSNFWSFSRANSTQRAELLIYSVSANKIIYTTTMEMIVGMGGDSQNQQELLQIAGETAAEKIIQVRSS